MVSTELHIKVVSSKEEYESFLASTENSLFYHSWDYGDLLARHLEAERIILGAFDDDNLVASFPFLMSKEGAYGRAINSMPYYGSNGGVLVCSDTDADREKEITELLLQRSREIATENQVGSMTIISNPLRPQSSQVLESVLDMEKTDQRIGQITPLPDSIEEDAVLLSVFDNPRPRNIRKAIKSGIVVEASNNQEDMDFLFEVHKSNIESIGGLSKKKEFFDTVLSVISENDWKIYVAKLDGKPVSALLLFYFGNTMEYFTPATVHDYRNIQPSSLLIFEGMKDGIEKGYKYFNWGGTWFTQEGVYNFKKKWGAQDFKYEYYTLILNQDIYKADRATLLGDYYGFYVISFDKLNDE